MKKSFAIILVMVLLVGLVSVAYAAHYTTLLCVSETCGGAYVAHTCDSESKTKTVVECPDAVVNCVCYEVVTTHYYSCDACGNTRIIRTTNYQHSK